MLNWQLELALKCWWICLWNYCAIQIWSISTIFGYILKRLVLATLGGLIINSYFIDIFLVSFYVIEISAVNWKGSFCHKEMFVIKFIPNFYFFIFHGPIHLYLYSWSSSSIFYDSIHKLKVQKIASMQSNQWELKFEIKFVYFQKSSEI